MTHPNTGLWLILGLLMGWLTFSAGWLCYRAVRRRWQRRHYGLPIEHSVLLVEYGRKLCGALDPTSLAQLLTVDAPSALGVDRATLLLPEGHQLVTVRTGAETDTVRLPVSHAGARWVTSAGEAQRTDRGQLADIIRQGPDELRWTRVWVPLVRGADLRGMWLLGPRRGKLDYAPDDLRWLTALARQATAVLEAAHYAEQERHVATEMRMLYRQVVAAREVERGRLARELHDGMLQDLCAIARDLKAMEAQRMAHAGTFEDVGKRTSENVQALRAICNDLRPPLLESDLVSALTALVEMLDARSPAPIRISVVTETLQLPDDVALAIFRIAQEALHNAIQHADASEIAVQIAQYPDRLRLTVTDDGRGIAEGKNLARFVAEEHFGLAGMRERAAMVGGKLDIQTALDYGTVIIFEIPHDAHLSPRPFANRPTT